MNHDVGGGSLISQSSRHRHLAVGLHLTGCEHHVGGVALIRGDLRTRQNPTTFGFQGQLDLTVRLGTDSYADGLSVMKSTPLRYPHPEPGRLRGFLAANGAHNGSHQ